MLSEKGSLKDTPAIKLLLTIFEQGLTGILYIKREDILKVLYFSRGKLIWAISNSDVDKLENILTARNLVNPDAILKVKQQSRVSDSIGKLLVEKGLITLEELIEASKEQLQRIIISVLKWRDGGFQFIKDAPPERLLSLDLDITQFIVNFIVDEIDLSEIWKEIGTLQVEFIKNPDKSKLEKYHLSDKQIQLLNSFDGEKKLETILSKHSGGHRESILKIIYFFLMAELLIKKEFELTDAAAFEEDKGFDYHLQPKEKNRNTELNKVPQYIAPIKTIANNSHSETTIPQKNQEHFAIDRINTDQTYQFRESKDAIKNSPNKPYLSPLSLGHETNDESRRKRFINISLILVFLILVIGGIILILLPWLEDIEHMKKMTQKTEKSTPDIIQFTESKAADLKNNSIVKQNDLKTHQPKSEITSQQLKDQKKDSKAQSSLKDENTSNLQKKSEKEKSEKATNKRPTTLPGKSPQQYFKEKNLITAGDVWKAELKKAKIKFSILLEMDCLKESVLHAYNRVKNKKDFFILNRKIGGKTCFLVLLGKFKSQKQATEALKTIPSYFWQQKDPPEVLELSKYL